MDGEEYNDSLRAKRVKMAMAITNTTPLKARPAGRTISFTLMEDSAGYGGEAW